MSNVLLPTVYCLLSTAYCLLPPASCLLLLLSGCSGSKPDPADKETEPTLAGVELRLAVVGDPGLAAAAERLRGEWNALTGCKVQVETIDEKDFDAADVLQHDAVICPSHHIGPLAENKRIAPLPEALIRGSAGEWSDVFELLQVRVASWGRENYAVPFGSPVLTCYYRADLFKKLDLQPPTTWAEYRQLAQALADQQPAGVDDWCGTIEPLAPGWAGLVLLARAAAYAKHPDNYSTLFDIQTMEPLIAGPPFVQALEELLAAAKSGPPQPTRYDPAAARAAFWQGKCGMALTWPSAADKAAHADIGQIAVGFAELPGSTEVFKIGEPQPKIRDKDDDPHVPLLAVAGRIGVVGAKSEHQRAAWELLFWLSGRQFSPRVSNESPATTLFRRSHGDAPHKWTEKPITTAAARQYAEVTETTLQRQESLSSPRIPGRLEYLSALDDAVHRALEGKQSAADALRDASTRWREITDRRQAERQKMAYLHSLGLP